MNKLAFLYGAGMYETLYLTKHTLAFHERYDKAMLTLMYEYAREVLEEQ